MKEIIYKIKILLIEDLIKLKKGSNMKIILSMLIIETLIGKIWPNI